jgi:hypothetical protein
LIFFIFLRIYNNNFLYFYQNLIVMQKLLTLSVIFLLLGCSKEVEVDFGFYDYTPVKKPVVFKNLTINANEYMWDFGDKTFSSEVSPTHLFNKAGKHTITLRAKSKNKNKDWVVCKKELMQSGVSYTVVNATDITLYDIFTVVVGGDVGDEEYEQNKVLKSNSSTESVCPSGTSVYVFFRDKNNTYLIKDPYILEKDKHTEILIKYSLQVYVL